MSVECQPVRLSGTRILSVRVTTRDSELVIADPSLPVTDLTVHKRTSPILLHSTDVIF